MPIELSDYLANTWASRKQVQDQLKLTILAAGLGKTHGPDLTTPFTQAHVPSGRFRAHG